MWGIGGWKEFSLGGKKCHRKREKEVLIETKQTRWVVLGKAEKLAG